MMRPMTALVPLLLTLPAAGSCRDAAPGEDATPGEEELRAHVVGALDSLAADLASSPPADADGYVERLRAYLEERPAFYGAAAALLSADGSVVASPYVHRTDDGYATLDLASPGYDIDEQDWVTMPLAAGAGVWTPPYFDAGGGEIWMITRSVPVGGGDGVFLVLTTDLPVDEPEA